jgi:hypothetical protein
VVETQAVTNPKRAVKIASAGGNVNEDLGHDCAMFGKVCNPAGVYQNLWVVKESTVLNFL